MCLVEVHHSGMPPPQVREMAGGPTDQALIAITDVG